MSGPVRDERAEPRDRVRPQRAARPRTRELSGLVVVVPVHGSLGRVSRCLEALRDSAEHRADVVLVGRPASEREAAAMRARFPFVRTAEGLDSALRPAGDDAAPPRFVLHVAPCAQVDRLAARALLRALASAPTGVALAPALVGPAGEEIDGPTDATAPIWIARRRDVLGGAPSDVRRRRDVEALVVRPDELTPAARSEREVVLQPFAPSAERPR